MHGSVSELGSIPDSWLADHADGIGCVISVSEFDDGTLPATSCVRR